jgi:hypothetical protein
VVAHHVAVTFFCEAFLNAVAWKQATPLLPDEARHPAAMIGSSSSKPYPHCLPPGFNAFNLLPNAREPALRFYATRRIPWQAGGLAGPSNNLLSSQVQCANLFAPLLSDADGVAALLDDVLPIDSVMAWPDGEYITFEWIGERDYLAEARPGTQRTRGSRATSADLAVRYRSTSGSVEVALIEWKYVEGTYSPDLGSGNHLRMARYRPHFEHPDSPIDGDKVRYEDLFINPLYQLLRLQLLAAAMERHYEHDATTVRVVLAAPIGNSAFHREVPVALRHHGDTVTAVWHEILREPDRFVTVDTAMLLRRADHGALVDRYRHLR